MKRLFPLWGALLLALQVVLNLSGATVFPTAQKRPEQHSVRNNPGAYRTHFFGGK